jgi:hypothetical protein
MLTSRYSSLDVRDFDLSWWPMLIPWFGPSMTGFDESGWLRGWPFGCVHSPAVNADHSQLSQALFWTEVESFRPLSNKTALHWFMCFIQNKLSCILCSFDVSYFHCCYFVSSWKQISFLYLEWFQMFVLDTVLYMYVHLKLTGGRLWNSMLEYHTYWRPSKRNAL